MSEKLDGSGQPFVTLAQYIKLLDLEPTGGAAKARVRLGDVKVNGTFEARPGRKLHTGDKVELEGKSHTVDLVALRAERE